MIIAKEPLVTVLIPVYNRPTIVSTIMSIINQSYKNVEILVVDNASTDQTVKLIKNIKDERIRLIINEQNMGQTYSLNRGLKEARGKYIARIDSDDIALPNRLEKQVSFLEDNPDYVLVGSWVRFISDENKLGMIVKMPTTDRGMRVMHSVACGMYHPSAMYRTSTIREHRIYYNSKLKMAEDYELWVRLMRHGKGCNLAEPLIYYRRGNNNDSSKYSVIMGEESKLIRLAYCQSLNLSNGEKRLIKKVIDIEEKEKKDIKECIFIYCFYNQYMSRHINKESEDYQIIKLHFHIKAYSSCFASNSAWFAVLVRKAYIILKWFRNKIGGLR